MSKSIIETTRKHGQEMRRLTLEHALEMAKIYRDFGSKPIDELIAHLETKLAEESEESEHSRFDEDHRRICEDCYSDWVDFCHDTAEDARLDAAEEEASDEQSN